MAFFFKTSSRSTATIIQVHLDLVCNVISQEKKTRKKNDRGIIVKKNSTVDSWMLLHLCKFLTMSTEFDKNSSKCSYSSTDYKNLIKKFFWTFSVKVIRPTKINIWRRHIRIKTFIKMRLSKNSFYKSWDPKLIFSNENFF